MADKYALVIGIPHYNSFKSLPKTTHDAETIAKILEKYGNYQVERLPKQANKTKDGYVMPEVGKDGETFKVTGATFGERLQMFVERAKGKNALIYFTGHGFTVVDNLEKKQGFLATSDCQVKTNAQNNKIIAQENGISLNSLNTVLAEVNFSSLVVLLDCCYAGAFLEEDSVSNDLRIFPTKTDYFLITACRSFERAKTVKSHEHSVFSGAIIEGLSEKNKNPDGEIDVNKLYSYIRQRISGGLQEPFCRGSSTGIILVRYEKRGVKEINETCPYQGLAYFTEETAKYFCGRQRVIEMLKQKLEQAAFVPVIGASGSGKSSVVRAGLIPWLRREGWQVLPAMVPLFNPLMKLKQVFDPLFKAEPEELKKVYRLIEKAPEGLSRVVSKLPREERMLLFVDQFEEVFTLCEEEKERKRFIELLTQGKTKEESRLSVVITMRIDFLKECLSYKPLFNFIQHQAVFMPPLTDDDLREIIVKPAEMQGYVFPDQLRQMISTDIAEEEKAAECLPLLEFTLTELWKPATEKEHEFSFEQYNQLGRVSGALKRRAEETYDEIGRKFDKQGQEWVKQIYLNLVKIGIGKNTRRPKPITDLLAIAGDKPEEQENILKVLQKLINERLLTTGSGDQSKYSEENLSHKEHLSHEVQLSHEALIEGWPRLAEWCDQERDLRRLIDRIEEEHEEWKNEEEKDSYLMRKGLLAEARDNWDKLKPILPQSVKDFFDISDTKEKEEQIAIERGEIEALSAVSETNFALGRKLEALIAGLKAGMKLKRAYWSSMYPHLQGQIVAALEQAILWIKERNRFEGHEEAVCSVSFSPDRQLLASAGRDRTIRIWNLDGSLATFFPAHLDKINSLSFSPDGQLLASASHDKKVKLWTTQDWKLLYELSGHQSRVNSVSFSSDGQLLASASQDKKVKLWKVQDGILLRTLCGHEEGITCANFSPDGQIVASASWDRTIKLWNSNDGELITSKENAHGSWVASVRFSPDGKLIASAGWDMKIKLWLLNDKPNGKPELKCLTEIDGHSDGIWGGVSFSPDGKMLASAGGDKVVKLWRLDGTRLTPVMTLTGHIRGLLSVTFSPDGKMLASASEDGTVRLWQPGNIFLKTLVGHSQEVRSLSFSPDSKTIASGSYDRSVKLWQSDGTLLSSLTGHSKPVWSVSFSPDGQLLASAGEDETVKLWKLDGTLLNTLKNNSWVLYVDFSPDNRTIACANYDGNIKLWRLDGTLLGTFTGHRDRIWNVCFSPDGQLLASAGEDRTVRIWKADGTLLNTLKDHTRRVWSVSFSPDGQMLASASGDKTVRLWQIDRSGTCTLLNTLVGHSDAVWSVSFSPDGQILASASQDQTVKLWRLPDGKLLNTLPGHSAGFAKVSFSPDGQMLASASSDGSIILWKLEVLRHLLLPDKLQLLNSLLTYGRDWVRDYLRTNPKVSKEDCHLLL